ncbi:MAG: hypothetical protein WD534_15115 [Phycisphaeraceae bacterium]
MPHPLTFIHAIDESLRSSSPRTSLQQLVAALASPQHPAHGSFKRVLAEAIRHADRLAIEEPSASEATVEAFASVQLLRDDEVLAATPLPEPDRPMIVADITPGSYQLQLDSGYVIWRDRLELQHVRLSSASDGGVLRLAADSEATSPASNEPGYQSLLFNGRWALRVDRGRDAGRLTFGPVSPHERRHLEERT